MSVQSGGAELLAVKAVSESISLEGLLSTLLSDLAGIGNGRNGAIPFANGSMDSGSF